MLVSIGEPPWGKAGRESEARHLLVHHAADVAAVFLELADKPVWRARLQKAAGRALTKTDMARLGVIAFLHDVGKLHPGFQAKAWPYSIWRGQTVSHLAAGWEILSEAIRRPDHPLAELLTDIQGWLPDEALLAAMLAHHGRPEPFSRSVGREWPVLDQYDWQLAARNFEATALAWFPTAFGSGPVLPDRSEFSHLFAGLLTLADWLASDVRRFPFRGRSHPDYFSHTAAKAAQAVAGAGVTLPVLTEVPSFRDLTGHAAATLHRR